jgi:hypothetical protein
VTNAVINHLRRRAPLLKAIEDAKHPQSLVQSLPSQAIYFALKQEGLSSCVDLINMASAQQIRLILDLDLWERDQLNEEAFWEWLSLPDADDSLDILEKILHNCDLKLVGILINRYVEATVCEEPTDEPPGARFVTPDKGYSWIRVNIENELHSFLLSRFLAFIFSKSPEIYYQILAIPGVATASVLEEEAFQERNGRLLGEGFPSADYCAELHAPISLSAVHQYLINEKSKTYIDAKMFGMEPLLHSSTDFPPLIDSILSHLPDTTKFEAELTLIMNSAILFYSVSFYHLEQVERLFAKVIGAIEIGLESILSSEELSNNSGTAIEIYERLGLQMLYRHGLDLLAKLQRLARSTSKKLQDKLDLEDPLFSLYLEGAMIRFPEIPEELPSSFQEKGKEKKSEKNYLSSKLLPIQSKQNLDIAIQVIEKLLNNS